VFTRVAAVTTGTIEAHTACGTCTRVIAALTGSARRTVLPNTKIRLELADRTFVATRVLGARTADLSDGTVLRLGPTAGDQTLNRTEKQESRSREVSYSETESSSVPPHRLRASSWLTMQAGCRAGRRDDAAAGG
jgi:hypothetical protein